MSLSPDVFAARRARFLETVGAGVAVIPAAPVFLRNGDVEHDYRPDSDLYYLTGFEEPHAVLVMTNQHPEHRSVLFVQRRDPEREIWDGPRAGVEGAVRDFGVDAAFNIEELAEKLPEYLCDVQRVHYRVGRGHPFDKQFFAAMNAVRRKARQGIAAPSEIIDPDRTVHGMRLRKGPEEIELMRRALDITGEAHYRAMQIAAPGRFEYEIEAEMRRIFRERGSERPAYGFIVGSGPNATILHYRTSRRQMLDGELLLIDAGCEFDGYASDITRTFPVNGKFTGPQKALYSICLEAEEKAIEATVVGANLDSIHEVAAKIIAQGLIDEGLIKGSLEQAMEEELYKPFYMHRTSHWLGMDVHDVGGYHADGKVRPLEAGMVLTVEPGIYVATDADVDERWRGIGIRIEDDILVTEDGNDNLSAAIPKSIEAVEAACAGE